MADFNELAVIEKRTLTGIADAIRAKGGTTATMTPGEMVAAIEAIPSVGQEFADYVDLISAIMGRKTSGVVVDNYTASFGSQSLQSNNVTGYELNAAEELLFGVLYANSNNVEYLKANNCKTIGDYIFWAAPKLTDAYLDSLESMHVSAFRASSSSSSLANVYIRNKAAAQILDMPGFPGMTSANNKNYANVVFHGSDADVKYVGGSWVVVERS